MTKLVSRKHVVCEYNEIRERGGVSQIPWKNK